MRFVIIWLLMGLSSVASAHEMTPTYPKLNQSIYDKVLVTDLVLFNRRSDVDYYAVEVWDEDWKGVPFATTEKIIKMDYLERKRIYIYIRLADVNRARYICTRSKILKGGGPTVIASNICSKIK